MSFRSRSLPDRAFLAACLLGLVLLPASSQAQPTQTLKVTSFGATGDGKTDDTRAIQKAVDASNPGDTLLFPAGTFLVRSVVLKAGVHYLGQGATIRRPDRQSKWTRTFTTAFSSDEDSPWTILEGLSFDGNRDGQGPYSKYELEQAHLVFLAADPAHKGRLRARVRNCQFRESVADGLSVYTNVELEAQNCSSYNCFRGGFVLTGGFSKALLKDFTSAGSALSSGIDIEVDGAGYQKSLRTEVRFERLRLEDGHFDIGISDGSKVVARDVISRSGFCLCAPNSEVHLTNCDLGVGPLSDAWNRIVFPGKTTFEKCRFTLRPELGQKSSPHGKWAAIHVYWNISGTSYAHQSLSFTDCSFAIDRLVDPADTTYGFYAERDAQPDNQLQLTRCAFSPDFDTQLEILGGALRLTSAP